MHGRVREHGAPTVDQGVGEGVAQRGCSSFYMLTLQLTIGYSLRLPRTNFVPQIMDMKTKRVPDPIFWAVGLCFWMVQMESCAPNHPKAIQTMAAATQSIDWKQFWWPTGISF